MQRFTPLQYLKIDIANSFGLDKENWDDRLAWFDKNEANLDLLLTQADEPAMFFAGVNAYNKALQGIPTGYPISLDATSSGLQILSLLTGCRKSAEMCNVLDVGKRMDAYTAIFQVMLDRGRISGFIGRKEVKTAIMTSLYSSQAEPEKIFGNKVEEFYQTMREEVPYAWSLNEAFIEMWDPEVDIHEWVLPDNFHVKIKVIDSVKETFEFLGKTKTIFRKVHQPTKFGRSLGANVVHSIDGLVVRELVGRCNYNPRVVGNVRLLLEGSYVPNETILDGDSFVVQDLWNHYLNSGFLSVRILEHLNRRNIHMADLDVIRDLVDSLPDYPFQVLTIHDCFRVLPNYGNDLREQYNLIYALIGKSSMLSFVVSQVLNESISVEKADPDMWKEVINSNYNLS